jgi:hypothetical protein
LSAVSASAPGWRLLRAAPQPRPGALGDGPLRADVLRRGPFLRIAVVRSQSLRPGVFRSWPLRAGVLGRNPLRAGVLGGGPWFGGVLARTLHARLRSGMPWRAGARHPSLAGRSGLLRTRPPMDGLLWAGVLWAGVLWALP